MASYLCIREGVGHPATYVELLSNLWGGTLPEIQKKFHKWYHLRPPHNVEYDTMFFPFIFTKKRYLGNLYQDDPDKSYHNAAAAGEDGGVQDRGQAGQVCACAQ